MKDINKTLRNKHIKSMLLWIITKKGMSIFGKTQRIRTFLLLKLLKNQYRKHSLCILLVSFHEHKPSFYKKVLRRTELLMNKGYTVQLELSWLEKASLHIDSESKKVLDQLIILQELQI